MSLGELVESDLYRPAIPDTSFSTTVNLLMFAGITSLVNFHYELMNYVADSGTIRGKLR